MPIELEIIEHAVYVHDTAIFCEDLLQGGFFEPLNGSRFTGLSWRSA